MKSEKEESLERIRKTQSELHAKLAALDREISALSDQHGRSPASDEALESSMAAPEAAEPAQRLFAAAKEAAVPPPLPPPLPPSIPETQAQQEEPGEKVLSTPPAKAQEELPPLSRPDSVAGIELKLGTYWLVRIGVLMVLTGFVFLAKHFLTSDEVAAGLKVSSLYLLSGALLGAGSWIGKTREKMRNYGDVLSAGGFAAVYFTTFGAHRVPGLAIISSPVLAGILLLFWAGVMVYVADRKRSQTLAGMGVFLAYYTLLIDESSLFSLFSLLILSGVAIVFLVRNRWMVIGSFILAGTYVAFAYWRFSEHLLLVGNVDSSPSSFWPSYGFLICYWATFTAAAFLPDNLPEKKRSLLAGLNNTAFLVLFGLGMGHHYPDQFWLFSLVAGVVFLALSEVADRRLGRGTTLGTLYLAKGLGLITLAVFLKLSGFSLSILIAAESCVLLVVASHRRSMVLEVSAYLSAGLAVLYTVVSETSGPERVWFVEFTDGIPAVAGFGQLIFLGVGAWWLRNRGEAIAPEVRLEPRCSILLGLGVLAFLCGAHDDIPEDWRPLVFVGLGAVAAVLGTWRRFKLVELAVVGQGFSVIGGIIILGQLAGPGGAPLVQSIPVLFLFLGLLHWSVDGRGPLAGKEGRGFFEWPFALLFVICLLPLVAQHAGFLEGVWHYLPGSFALLLLLYGYRMRIPALAILSQGYHLFAAVEIAVGGTGQGSWLLALVPLVLLLCNIVVADLLFRSAEPDRRSQNTLDGIATGLCLLRILALYFFTDFVFGHLPEIWQAPTFSLAALILHTLAIRRKNIQRFTFGLILLGASAALVLLRDAWDSNPAWQTYLTALVPLVVQQLTRRKGGLAAEHLIYHLALSTSSIGLIWLVLSLEVDAIGQGFYLTASWTLLGALVFAAGWFLRERIYRLMSLSLITAALARLLVMEVWTLESIGRIITFILIGLVLLSVGFVYTRYQDKLRRIF